jgi:hypothetical protein
VAEAVSPHLDESGTRVVSVKGVHADDAHLWVAHGHLSIGRFLVVKTEHNRGQPLHVPSAGLPHNFLATGGEEGEVARGDGFRALHKATVVLAAFAVVDEANFLLEDWGAV